MLWNVPPRTPEAAAAVDAEGLKDIVGRDGGGVACGGELGDDFAESGWGYL